MTALSHEGCSPEAINVACAERLGWKRHSECDAVWVRPGCVENRVGSNTACIPNFHGSLDAAMQLVERAREMGWLWMSDNLVKQGDVFTVFFKNKSSAHHASAPKPAAAICEAFLKLPPCP